MYYILKNVKVLFLYPGHFGPKLKNKLFYLDCLTFDEMVVVGLSVFYREISLLLCI